MKQLLNKTSAAIFLVAACALPLSANAQNDEGKKALATKLAQIQQKSDAAQLTEQLVASVAQPVIAAWSQRLDETVPPAKQKDVRDKLDAELKKLIDNTRKTIEAQANKTAEAALVAVYTEKLTEDELKTVIAYLESPASAKFQSVGGEAANAWATKVVEATRTAVEGHVKSFDAAAAKIVGAPAPAAKSGGKK